ncbi:hypothetical protein [uncultured Cetobacterium sp.]|nr:hypothetical protein [uncultured Cetobacterium sp.]
MKNIFLITIISLFVLIIGGCSNVEIEREAVEVPQQDFPFEPRGF